MNIAEILKNTPEGTKLYSTVYGEVTFVKVENDTNQHIILILPNGNETWFSKEGTWSTVYPGECVLFPSRENRDWSTFKIKSRYKLGDYLLRKSTNRVYRIFAVHSLGTYDIEPIDDAYPGIAYVSTKVLDEEFEICKRFPLDSLRPFDRVLVRNADSMWACALFSYAVSNTQIKAACQYWNRCVPYNDETKHLIGTTDDAPEFYK